MGVLALALGLSGPASGWCADIGNPYEAQTIVTGQRDDTRGPGIQRCFDDVLVKVSGDPRLIDDPAVETLRNQAAGFVRTYRYHDRLSDRPIHDEQGTRDRPHDLTVDFAPDKIDAVLRRLGRQPWSADRPRLAFLVAVQQGDATYLLSRDGERSYSQRAALAAASQQIGLPIALPDEAQLLAAGLSGGSIPDPGSGSQFLQPLAADLPLTGTLRFDEQALGWVAHWSLTSGGRTSTWDIAGVSFDEAFRNALRGAAQILSGHGQPD